MADPYKIAVLISGSGTTLRNLLQKKADSRFNASVELVVSSNEKAKGNQIALDHGIGQQIVDHQQVREPDFSNTIFEYCRKANVELVVCGGFLRKLSIPADFENRVINIHPSLIPAFCGKGHYGSRVHQAVIDYGCKLTGCTVHFVDNEYDHGPVIAQASVPVLPNDDASSLAKRVFATECELYPQVINAFAAGRVKHQGRVVTIESS